MQSLPGDPCEENRPRQVPHACYSRVNPTPVSKPELLALVPEVSSLLELEPKQTPALLEALSGNRVLAGMAPYAACYGGHQFGHWAGQLGDGRAITLAEVVNDSGESWEMQLKGAGPTPYSRSADGRAVLRSSLRELVCSEAMYHLGVPTTRALSLILTGDQVKRDLLYDGNARLEPGAIVCRVAPSFLRFGNYEIHAARRDAATLDRLVRFTLETQFPSFLRAGAADVAGFLQEVCLRTARLMVEWMRVGFVHGVMNTDNMSILGLTIDYGPFGFMDSFDPEWTPNITDAAGRRYRFENQPSVAHWNLLQFARALSPLVTELEPLERALNSYREEFEGGYQKMMLAKLGLLPDAVSAGNNADLVPSLLSLLRATEIDMTLFFRRLADLRLDGGAISSEAALETLGEAFYAPESVNAPELAFLEQWLSEYRAEAQRAGLNDAERRQRMHGVNPLYVPRNYLLQIAIDKTEQGDRHELTKLLQVLRNPYTEQPGCEAFAGKRPEWARNRPGCSMLSCSS